MWIRGGRGGGKTLIHKMWIKNMFFFLNPSLTTLTLQTFERYAQYLRFYLVRGQTRQGKFLAFNLTLYHMVIVSTLAIQLKLKKRDK